MNWCSGEDNGGNNVSNGSFGAHSMVNFNQLSLEDKCLMRDKETLMFEYMEREQPHNRRTLTEKVSMLASRFPELNNYRSCDLSSSSWICLAWYPIYRLSIGPTLKQLEASFLTLHSLSTQPGSYSEPMFASASSQELRLPVIGMASYRLKGSLISPQGPECEQERALWKAAADWVHHVQAFIPDYQFFLNHNYR